MTLVWLILLAPISTAFAQAPCEAITLAGPSTSAAGDGGLATEAQLNHSGAVHRDPTGTIWIADWGNRRIRKISPDGIIFTVAGDGSNERIPDGNDPKAGGAFAVQLVFSPDGSVYWWERPGNIRRLTPDGTIDTVARNLGWDLEFALWDGALVFTSPSRTAIYRSDASGTVSLFA